MSTIVNNPTPTQTTESGGSTFLIGVILFIGFVMVLLYFGIPVIQRIGSGKVELNIPAPQIVVPEEVNLNVIQKE